MDRGGEGSWQQRSSQGSLLLAHGGEDVDRVGEGIPWLLLAQIESASQIEAPGGEGANRVGEGIPWLLAVGIKLASRIEVPGGVADRGFSSRWWRGLRFLVMTWIGEDLLASALGFDSLQRERGGLPGSWRGWDSAGAGRRVRRRSRAHGMSCCELAEE
jgi:hypothetical protein